MGDAAASGPFSLPVLVALIGVGVVFVIGLVAGRAREPEAARPARKTDHSAVKHVSAPGDFKELVGGEKLTVVDFFAEWCGPCKAIAPFIEDLAAERADVNFVKVDVDQASEIAAEQGIRAMPTFKFFKNGKLLEEFKGANKGKLQELVSKYA